MPILDAMTFGELFNALAFVLSRRIVNARSILVGDRLFHLKNTVLPNRFAGIPIHFGKWQILVGDVD
jgi:hypothetical protein